MTSSQQPFIDYSTLAPFPAQPSRQQRRPAWLIGLFVTCWTAIGGTVLGPVAAVVLFDLSPLHPLTIALGVAVGAAYGLAAGLFLGPVTALAVLVVRSSPSDGSPR